jgi:hypothetical protein
MTDYTEINHARREDRKFFERHPDRQYRVRRAWRCEIAGERPPGFEVFAILHRQDVEHPDTHIHFAAPVTFETDTNDATIRRLIATLAANPKALLNGNR